MLHCSFGFCSVETSGTQAHKVRGKNANDAAAITEAAFGRDRNDLTAIGWSLISFATIVRFHARDYLALHSLRGVSKAPMRLLHLYGLKVKNKNCISRNEEMACDWLLWNK
jgi:hypothetical protein